VSWSPVDDVLAVTQGTILWLYPVDGGSPRRVDLGGGPDRITWAPDGSRFVTDCSSPTYPYAHLCVVTTRDGRAVVVEVADVTSPVWSPDSRYFITTTNEGSESTLVVFRADGGGGTAVPIGALPASDPRWLP